MPPDATAAPLVPGVAHAPIVCDGRLDEADWAAAPVIDGLRSYSPQAGEPDPGTTVRVLQDDKALYFAITVTTPHALDGGIVPRDATTFMDWVGLVLDTFHDGQRGFAFRVNPSGVQADGIYTEGDSLWMQDLSWDEVWSSGGTHDATGYTVEFALPFRSLRYPRGEAQDWGLVVLHFQPRPWELYAWPALTQDAPTVLGQAAHLAPRAPKEDTVRVEAVPTLTGLYDVVAQKPDVQPGVSGRLGFSSAVTLDVAINPDFSQIEADALQVTANTKYPLEYDEKRPFFLEAADLYALPIDIVYSRSIVDPFAGAKVGGRAGRVGFGVLSAWDTAPAASTLSMDYASGEPLPTWDADTVDGARALDSLARLRVDVGEGRSVGLVATDKELYTADGNRLGNHVGGADLFLPFGGRYQARAVALVSSTDFPDAPTAVAPALYGSLTRKSEKLSGSVSAHWLGSGFRAEDGFLGDVGRIGGRGSVGYTFQKAGPFRAFEPSFVVSGNVDEAGTWTDGHVGLGVETFIGEPTYVEVEALVQHERYDTVDFDLWNASAFWVTDVTATTYVDASVAAGPTPFYDAESVAELYTGFDWYGQVEAGTKLWSRLRLDLSVTEDNFRDAPLGASVYDTLLGRLSANLNLTRELRLRLIEDWDVHGDVLDTSVLLGWEHDYGSAIYVGYSDAYDLADTRWDEQEVFAKVGWLFRI